ncbi:hypothetical protein PMAYCL1PPCAC_21568, partial [Pristionchus mayeri]
MTSYAVSIDKRPMVLFFTWRSKYSNHHPCSFVDKDGIRYNCSEQFYISAERIMEERWPRDQKEIGKNLNGFNAQSWDKVSRGVMREGLLLKFEQDEGLRRALISTGDSLLVECSPNDTKWGIGLDRLDPRAHDPSKWRCANWLGQVLMEVRDSLKVV